MRERSYLTAGTQLFFGALTLIACIAWPPLFFLLVAYAFVRYLARARKGSTRSVMVAAIAVVVVGFGLTVVVSDFAVPIVIAVALLWLASSRIGRERQEAAKPLT